MIVHSVANRLDGTTLVRVESIAGEPDERVALFAMGAAGLRNAGYHISGGRVVSYYDENSRRIPAGDDTSNAMGATVTCTITEQIS